MQSTETRARSFGRLEREGDGAQGCADPSYQAILEAVGDGILASLRRHNAELRRRLRVFTFNLPLAGARP